MSQVRRPEVSLPPSSRMQLMWLASPALPVGGFSYSEALEAAVDTGRIRHEADASNWLQDQLMLSLARSDLAVVAKALPAWLRSDMDRIQELNHWVGRTRETSELRLQTEQMGRSLVEWLRNKPEADPRTQLCGELQPAPTWPVAFGLAAAQCLPLDNGRSCQATAAVIQDVLLSYAFGWAENMVQAAIKAVPFGQSAGQRILQSLCEHIPTAIEAAMQMHDSERQAFTPMLAILSAQHETQYSRLFRS